RAEGANSLADGTFQDDAEARAAAVRNLSPLPGTARELRQIAMHFSAGSAQLYLRSDATEITVKNLDLSSAAIISFATHGLITGDVPGLSEPALALTPPDHAAGPDDGLLTASEASTLDIHADWVILSACNTAVADGTPGAEGLSGLARAFLFAGAKSLLVSHWPVRDDVAATLTADTLRRLQENPDLARARALQLAITFLRNDLSDPSLAHPSAWAPFVVVGEGGALARQ
ncbi:MAG: CHAT domain-containing protein, partial [Rhodobacteraceae bacterium]|nr:CHAT domain-containing protein [Paracoccaceae bacterium]